MAGRGRTVNWGHRMTGSGRLLGRAYRMNNRDHRMGNQGFLVHRVAEAAQSPFSASTASVYPRQYSQVT